MWCFEKLIKFLTKNAFIIVGIEGTGFCRSALRSSKLIFANMLRMAALTGVMPLYLFFSKVSVSLWSSLVAYYILTTSDRYTAGGEFEIGSANIPCLCVFMLSYIVSAAFFEAYSMTIDTLMLSFCLEEAKLKEGVKFDVSYAKIHGLD